MQSSPYSDADLVAAYDRLALTHHFAAPARDLVSVLEIAPGAAVLDVGSGTGAVAIAARDAVGHAGRVVGLEPSLALLGVLKAKRICDAVAGAAPGLPFGAACFDRVLASFVLSHLDDYAGALTDMVRVLRPGGRLGVSAWGPGQTEFMRLWKDIVAEFVNIDRFQQSVRSIIPWDERFSDRGHIARALEAAGLVAVDVHARAYVVKVGVVDWLGMRDCSVEGTLLRRQLEARRWQMLQQEMQSRFRSRFGDTIEYSREVLLACGTAAGMPPSPPPQ